MSTARHHAEWLSLVEVSGPFLSIPVLLEAFPQGLDAHDPDSLRELRLAYDEWQDGLGDPKKKGAIHQAFVDFVFRRILGWTEEVRKEAQALPDSLSARFAEHHETLRPDLAIVNPAGGPNPVQPRVLVQILPPGQDLERAIPGKAWKATPATRMMELLHATGVRLGLCTNGEHFLLVDAPRSQTTGFASFYAALFLEEHLTLRAFRSLLSARRFFGVADDQTLENLLTRSAEDQHELTNQLGVQVRRAIEVLIQAVDRIDRDQGRKLLAGVTETTLYESALNVMMRLCFLLFAEEQELLPVQSELYQRHYAISPLRAQLREVADRAGEEILERRQDAWGRLLALFRAVYGGVRHQDLHLPAYGGRLFDPDRFPFLEGRLAGTSWRDTPSRPLPIHNRTVLHLLEALQILQVRLPGGGKPEARKLSFRALGIEQIGHVYEGLLDHTAVRARGPVLGIAGGKNDKGGRDREPEIPLAELEALLAKGEDAIVERLTQSTGRTAPGLRKALGFTIPKDDARYLVACDNGQELYRRIQPFAGLLRRDSNDYPAIVPDGSVYVTQGTDRRSSGTHYTPPALTEGLVRHTLDPLCYDGPAQGKPREEWKLRTAREILALRICDIAMGSGAFLVQVCRYLGERLTEAWAEAEKEAGGRLVVTPEGDLATGAPAERPMPRDDKERALIARRLVADRCVFGVDKNPMAVEMAKLSLWLVTMQKDRPFTFLDHALRCGDSLLGLTQREQLERFHLDAERPPQGYTKELRYVAEQACGPALAVALEKRRQLESFSVETARDAEQKQRLLQEADAALAELHLLADLVVGSGLYTAGKGSRAIDDRLETFATPLVRVVDNRVQGEERKKELALLRRQAHQMLDEGRESDQPERHPFHWVLEFPEVFLSDSCERRGFDAIVGNPPYQGGQKITGVLGTDYRDFLVEHVAAGQRGSADLSAYFFLRGRQLLKESGGCGFVVTNTIAQGDTREVGLERLLAQGMTIPRAMPSFKWPGTANLEVVLVWLSKGKWSGPHYLDGQEVPNITAFLTAPGESEGKPSRLRANEGKSFQGSIVLGMGFVLEPEEAHALIHKDPRNKDVLFQYLNGEDLNSRPDQTPSRWVINFRDWPLEKCQEYPDCYRIVLEKVKPERDTVTFSKNARDQWWLYERPRAELYNSITGKDHILVIPETTKFCAFSVTATGAIFSHMTKVFILEPTMYYAVLSSSLHECWARLYSSTLESRLKYIITDAFETFPFPTDLSGMKSIGQSYHDHRRDIMLARQEGLTKTYNRFHNPADRAADIEKLRALHVEMDDSVATAYGWSDLDLGHGFHQTRQGIRYTLSEATRKTVLSRLLKLNHQRYEEEVKQGLHEKKTAKGKATSKPAGSSAAARKKKAGEPSSEPSSGSGSQGSLF